MLSYTLAVLGVFVAVGLVLTLIRRWRWRRIVLARSAAGHDLTSFKATLADVAADDLLEGVYRYLGALSVKNFPVVPSDDVRLMFAIDDDEVLEEYLLIADAVGVPHPSLEDACKVRTVGELVALLEQQRRSMISNPV